MAKDASGNTYVSEAQGNTRNKRDRDAQEKSAARDFRKIQRDARSDEQQLVRLDAMFGKDLGAVRERARLNKRIAKNKTTIKKVKSPAQIGEKD